MKTKILLAVLFLLPQALQARLAVIADFPYILLDSYTEIRVNDDGSSETLSTMTYKVLRDEAKEHLSLYKLQYDSSLEDMNVIEAFSENASGKIYVDKSNIQKSAIAAKANGIVNNSEIAIPFSQVKQDSKVYLKLHSKMKKATFGNVFFQNIYWGDLLPEKSSLAIRSNHPLYYKLNDPSKILEVTNNKEKDGKYWLRASMKDQFVNVAVQELGKITKNDSTYLSISNIDKWANFRNVINTTYEPVLKEKLPLELLKITNSIQAKASFEQKISTVLEYITSNYNYLGDWRGKGKYIPKLASKITADRFGDCKDFATLLVKMLREMKIQADYALVERSYEPLNISEDFIPSLDYFNHIIVRVQNNQDVYWIDPTNNFSLGLENRYDISERNVFVLGNVLPLIQSVQKTNKDRKFYTNKRVYTFLSDDEADVEGTYAVEGENSWIIQDSLKNKQMTEQQDLFKMLIAQGERAVFLDFQSKNAKKNAYYDLDLSYKYKTNGLNQKKEKADNANILVLPNLSLLGTFRASRVSDNGTVNISLMPSFHDEVLYKNVYLSGKTPVGCDIKSSWVDATRKIELLPEGIFVKDHVNFKKGKLTPIDFKDVGFATVADELASCFIGNYITFDFGTKKHIDRNSNFESSIANLAPAQKLERRRVVALAIIDNRSGEKTKESLGLDDAKTLLEKNLLESPNDSETLRLLGVYFWNNSLIIGRDYEINSLNRALDYVNKAIAADKNNNLAYVDKVGILLDLGKDEESWINLNAFVLGFDKSKMSYTEARKITKILYKFQDDKFVPEYFNIALKASKTNKEKSTLYSMRAMSHLEVGRNQDCIANYKWAIKLDGTQAWDHGNLSICYNSLQKYDDAIQSAKNAISIIDYGAAHGYLASAYLGKAKLEMIKKNFKDAEGLLQYALLEKPGVEVYLNLAKVYLELKQEEKAKAMAQKCFEYEDRYNSSGNINREVASLFKDYGIEQK